MAAPAAAAWTEGFLHANSINIRYLSSVPPPSVSLPKLVFLHGLFAAGPVVLPVLAFLTGDFQVFLPDARGHGGSQPLPEGSFSMENLVADAVAAIKHFGNGEAVLLAGHSMGASTAARVAKLYPHLVRALVLEEPPWLRLEGEPVVQREDHPWSRGKEEVKGEGKEDSVGEREQEGQKGWGGRGGESGGGRGGGRGGRGRGRGNPFLVARHWQRMSEEEFENAYAGEAQNLPPFAYTMTKSFRLMAVDVVEPTFKETDDVINEAVNEIQVPALLMSGNPGGHCKEEVAEKTVATWSRGELRNWEGAGHVIHMQPRTAEYVEVLRSFFKKAIDEGGA